METEIMGNKVQFAASLIISGYSSSQLKRIIPEYSNMDVNTFIKTVLDTASRHFRKEFIERLEGNMPRLLTEDEKVTIVNEVEGISEPNGKAKLGNVQHIIDMIALDVENPELIVPAKKTPSRKNLTREEIEPKLARLNRGLTKNQKNLEKLNKRLNAARGELVADPESKLAKYTVIKTEFDINVTQKAIDKEQISINSLNEMLARIPVVEVVDQPST